MASLIVFYSRAQNNYVNGTIKNLAVGNTEVCAKILQKITGADIFKIEQVTPYAADYNECIQQAKEDQQRDARPELASYLKCIDKYDVIYLGYPNYWGTIPMAVATFLERYDFTGKTIMPFCTHEGSAMGMSECDIKTLCPGAAVKDGLAIHGAEAAQSETKFKNWPV